MKPYTEFADTFRASLGGEPMSLRNMTKNPPAQKVLGRAYPDGIVNRKISALAGEGPIIGQETLLKSSEKK